MAVGVKNLEDTVKFYKDMGFDFSGGSMKFIKDKLLWRICWHLRQERISGDVRTDSGDHGFARGISHEQRMSRTPFHLNVFDPWRGRHGIARQRSGWPADESESQGRARGIGERSARAM